MRNIKGGDKVFQELMSEEERFRFSMFHGIGENSDSFIITNDSNIIIGQPRPTSPLWIYIKNDLSNDERAEVIKIICDRLEINPRLCVDGEEEYMRPILEEVSRITGIPFKVSITKNSYFCREAITPKMISGELSKPREEDLEVLTIFSRDNWEDIGFGILTSEQAIKFAQRKLIKPDFHLWRNEEGRVVAMASVHKYGNIAITDGVFTDRSQRNKGYGKFLMYRITEELIKEGFMPTLYADSSKGAPNHVYKSIGYKYCGKVTEFRFL